MKNLGTFLSVISIVVGITACEKSPEVPEVEFDLSLIPGEYNSYTYVHGPNSVRRIPKNSPQTYIMHVKKVKENLYAFEFGSKNPILPVEITVEITKFRDHYGWPTAELRVLETDSMMEIGSHFMYSKQYHWISYRQADLANPAMNLVFHQ